MTAVRMFVGVAGVVLILIAQAQADPPMDGCDVVCLERSNFILSPTMACVSFDDPVWQVCLEGRCKGVPLPNAKCEKAGTTIFRQWSAGCSAKCDLPLNKASEASMGAPPQIGAAFDVDLTICTTPLGGGINPP